MPQLEENMMKEAEEVYKNFTSASSTGSGRRLLWDFGCCSGGLANPFTSGDGADCNTNPGAHESGAGYQLSEACRTHDSCLAGCNGACGCQGSCDSQLASQAFRASCSNGKS